MTRRPASSSGPAQPLASASTLARGATFAAPGSLAPISFGQRPAAAAAGRLQELQLLNVDQVVVLADDVRVAHRLQELLRALEIAKPDLYAAEPLRHMAVGPGARNDRVLAGEADRLLVEGREGDPRVEDLEDVYLLDHLQQVLIVGHRVEAVEGMRHVDQGALPPDLGDRLRHRHPALDLLLQEQADHLTLVRGFHLLGDDHLDPADPLGLLPRLERSGDLVVVGDRDRPQVTRLRGLKQKLHGGRAIGRVVGVHVKVAVDVLPPVESPTDLRIARWVVAPSGDSPVDRLNLVGDLCPAPPLPTVLAAGPELLSELMIRAQPLELGRQRLCVAEREEQALLALADELAVELEVGDHRNSAHRQPLPDQAGGNADAARGEADDVAPGDELRWLAVGRANDSQSLSQAPADPGQRVGWAVEPDDALPIEVAGEPAKCTEEHPQGAALLLGAVHDSDPPVRRRGKRGLGH